MRGGQVLGVQALQAGHTELRAELAQAQRRVELPGLAVGDRQPRGEHRLRMLLAVDQHLGRRQARQPRAEFALATLRQADLALCHRQPGQADGLALGRERQQDRVLLVGQQFRIGDGAGRHDAHHLALDRALGCADLADLLGDRHRFAKPDQLAQVGLERMHRHPGHDDRFAAALAARGQCDVQQRVGLAGIVEEDLVEVPHAIEHQRVGMVGLDAKVLLHHGRVLAEIVGRGAAHRRREMDNALGGRASRWVAGKGV